MALHLSSKRIPQIFKQFQADPRFRHAALAIAQAIDGLSEQDARDALLMAERLGYWRTISDNPSTVYAEDLAERDAVLQGVQ